MAELNKNKGLDIKQNPIQPRDTKLGSLNHVLTPNKLKMNLVDESAKDNRVNRVTNISTDKLNNKNWWKK